MLNGYLIVVCNEFTCKRTNFSIPCSVLFLVVQSSTQTSLTVPVQESRQSIDSRTHLFGRIFKFWVQQ